VIKFRRTHLILLALIALFVVGFVGVVSACTTIPFLSIDIEKYTNGQDADEAPGPYITVGGTVTWTYVVTNTGDVTLTNLTVTDDVLGQIGTIASLAPNASETFTITGTAVAGQYENIGTVAYSYLCLYDSDSDNSHYYGTEPQPEPSSIGDRVWNDADAEGDQDGGESGINGVTVDLWLDADSSGTINAGDTNLGTQTTAGDGDYDFTGLAAGDYIVDVTDTDGVLTGYVLTGGIEPLVVILGAGVDYNDADFGYYQVPQEPEISIDIEKSTNGQDADMAPGPYITVGGTVTWTYVVTNTGDVTLYDIIVTDDVLGSIGTIDSLALGASETFTVNGIAVAGQYENIGTVTAVANQYNGIVAAVYEEEIPYSDSDPSHYYGTVPPPPPPPPPAMASLGDRIWYDADADGVQDAGESGINGVTVDLWLDDGDGIIDGGDTFIGTQTTTGDGGYNFTGLAAGDYIVDVTDTGGVLAGFELISGTDPLVVVLGAGVNYIDADFGYQAAALPYTEPGSISGTVFADIDGDDIQDEDEPGVSGVTVTLSGDDSATTTTDADGYYIFADLLPGNYTVTITVPDGYTSVDPDISVVLAMGEDKVVNFPLDPKMLPYTEEESLEVLPYTGFNFVLWWLFGLGLMGAGITLLTLSKQREF